MKIVSELHEKSKDNERKIEEIEMSLESKKIKFSRAFILGGEKAVVGRQISWRIKIMPSEKINTGGKIGIMAYGDS